jgi:hypothetical protein
VHVVGKPVHQQALNLVLMGAGLLAARRAHAGHGGAHAGAGAAEVPAVLVDLVEEVLGVLGGGTDEHDVAGLAVKGLQARAPLFPGVRQLAQHVGGVKVAGGRLYAQGVEFLGFGEGLADLGEARNDAAAVAVHRDRAALPVTLARFVGVFELTEQVVGHLVDALARVLVAQTLDAGDEAGPGALFEHVQHRGFVGLDRHCDLPPMRLVNQP